MLTASGAARSLPAIIDGSAALTRRKLLDA
jgi:hypothetical protein